MDDDFRGRLLKKKLAQSRQLSTWLSDIASHLQLFWVQTFFCDLSHIHTRVSFQPSAHCNLTWLCCFILMWALFWRDTLFWLFGTSRIVQIPSFYSNTSGNDDWKVEQINEDCLGLYHVQAKSMEISFSHAKKNCGHSQKEYSKSICTSKWACQRQSLSAVAGAVCACAKAVPECCSKSSAIKWSMWSLNFVFGLLKKPTLSQAVSGFSGSSPWMFDPSNWRDSAWQPATSQ